MVGFGLDYACAHIIIPASVNLLPIQADFVTERVKTSGFLVVLSQHAEVDPGWGLGGLQPPVLSSAPGKERGKRAQSRAKPLRDPACGIKQARYVRTNYHSQRIE